MPREAPELQAPDAQCFADACCLVVAAAGELLLAPHRGGGARGSGGSHVFVGCPGTEVSGQAWREVGQEAWTPPAGCWEG